MARGWEEARHALADHDRVDEQMQLVYQALADRPANCSRAARDGDVAAVLRDSDELRRLVDASPFAGIEVTPQTRPHVTFLKRQPVTKPALPLRVPEKGYAILCMSREPSAASSISSGPTTPDLMQRLDREFGADVTTRSWGTVERVLRAAS